MARLQLRPGDAAISGPNMCEEGFYLTGLIVAHCRIYNIYGRNMRNRRP